MRPHPIHEEKGWMRRIQPGRSGLERVHTSRGSCRRLDRLMERLAEDLKRFIKEDVIWTGLKRPARVQFHI